MKSKVDKLQGIWERSKILRKDQRILIYLTVSKN